MICLKASAAGSLEIRSFTRDPVIFEFCYENRALMPYYAGNGEKVPLNNPGINIDILRQLDAAMPEVTISYQRKPWKGCLSNIADGKVNGVIASYYKVRESIGQYPKRNGELDEQRRIGNANYCLYKTPGSLLDYNGHYFSGIGFSPIAVPSGYSIISKLKAEQLMYFEVSSSSKGFELLMRRAVAGVVTLCEVGERLIKANPMAYGHFVEDRPQLVKRSAYLMVSKRFYRSHRDLVEKMWAYLKTVNDSALR